MSVGCDGVRVLRWKVVFQVPRLQKPQRCECRRGTAVRVVTKRTHMQYSVSDAKEHRHVPRKISAACSLFLADQRQRYYSIMSVCARARALASLRDPAHTHVMTKYWWNLIWRCVHNPPNRQIKFPAKFSGHTVLDFQKGLQ